LKKCAENLCRIRENGAQNLQAMCAEFSVFRRRILTALATRAFYAVRVMSEMLVLRCYRRRLIDR